jgi:hypothetical protein
MRTTYNNTYELSILNANYTIIYDLTMTKQ